MFVGVARDTTLRTPVMYLQANMMPFSILTLSVDSFIYNMNGHTPAWQLLSLVPFSVNFSGMPAWMSVMASRVIAFNTVRASCPASRHD